MEMGISFSVRARNQSGAAVAFIHIIKKEQYRNAIVVRVRIKRMVGMIFDSSPCPGKLVVEFAVMKKDVRPNKIRNDLGQVAFKEQPLVNLGDISRICDPTQAGIGGSVPLFEIETGLAIGSVKTVIGLVLTTFLYPLLQL